MAIIAGHKVIDVFSFTFYWLYNLKKKRKKNDVGNELLHTRNGLFFGSFRKHELEV